MAKRKIKMTKGSKGSNRSSGGIFKSLYEDFIEGLGSEDPGEHPGCGCIIILLIIGLVFCFLIAYNRYQKIDDKYNKDNPNIELLDKYIKKAQ